MSVLKTICFSDFHADPDPATMRIALDFLKDFKPDKTIFLGDILDCASIGKYVTPDDPDLQDEVDIVTDLLDEFDPDVWIDGNHEQRLERADIPKQWKSLFNVEKLLELRERGIIYRPYHRSRIYRIRGFKYLHGFSCGQTSARKVASIWGNCAMGHTHRVNDGTFQVGDGSAHCYQIGCMCKKDQGYNMVKEAAGEENGFGFCYHKKSGRFNFYNVRIDGQKAIINGKDYG